MQSSVLIGTKTSYMKHYPREGLSPVLVLVLDGINFEQIKKHDLMVGRILLIQQTIL